MIHLPLYQYPREQGAFGSLFGKVNRLHIVLTDVLANWKRRKGAGVMRFTSYSLSALHTFLAELGFKNIEFRFFETASNGELHPCVLATK